jgi:DNA-binding response OmpR family regulator
LIEIDRNISYDIDNCELIIDDNIISLGQKEAKLLNLFIKNQDRVLSHDTIYDYLWNFDETYSDNALRTYIKNIRKLIGKDKIVSIKKQGYKFIT